MYSVFKSAANESSINPSPYCMCVMVEHIISDITIETVTNFSLASNKMIVFTTHTNFPFVSHCYEYLPKYGIERKSLYALNIKQIR